MREDPPVESGSPALPAAERPDFSTFPLCGWYPGHMLRTDRGFKTRLKLVDLVVEILDARAPAVSVNPEIQRLSAGKPRFLVFSKSDLASRSRLRQWGRHFEERGVRYWFGDLRSQAAAARLPSLWRQTANANPQTDGNPRGSGRRAFRVMIAGIPNVGKSTLINRLAAHRKTAVGPRPGVTRGHQWVPLQGGIELLDTPGVLWPRLRNKEQELELGTIGAIPDDLIGAELLCEFLWCRLIDSPEPVRWDLYDLGSPPGTAADLLSAVARRRGLLETGGRPDFARSAAALLKDFREGRLGRFTLDVPPSASRAMDNEES